MNSHFLQLCRGPLAWLAVCAAGVAPAAAATATDRAVTLEAIHWLENPRDLMRPGPCGELGAYQFREATWRMYTNEPFTRALDRQTSDCVAEKHYDWIKRQLESAHVAVTPYAVALAWNGGITAATRGRAPRSVRNYAERAANLASVLPRADATPPPRGELVAFAR
jgi:hypothetical protein